MRMGRFGRLGRGWRSHRRHILHREQRLAVQHGQELDAGVHRLQRQAALPVQHAQHHGAGAAVAFVAAFLGAAATRVFAQPLQHAAGGRGVVDFHQRAAVEKAHGAGIHGDFHGCCILAWDLPRR